MPAATRFRRRPCGLSFRYSLSEIGVGRLTAQCDGTKTRGEFDFGGQCRCWDAGSDLQESGGSPHRPYVEWKIASILQLVVLYN